MKTILLVNHVEAFLGRNKSLLNRAGFQIATATSADEALQVYREQPVDLIISLLEMPEMGGDALCKLIRLDEELKNVPFMMVCYDTEAELDRATQCGANAVVIKPVRPEMLLEQVGIFLSIPIRRDFRAPFNARVHGMRGTLSFSGVTRNISVSGVLCETEMRLNHDDLITNLFLTIESHRIIADGKVIWSETGPDGMYHYGVKFTMIPPECREKIEQFVSSV
jgi:CheY-like chemotaxis protein